MTVCNSVQAAVAAEHKALTDMCVYFRETDRMRYVDCTQCRIKLDSVKQGFCEHFATCMK